MKELTELSIRWLECKQKEKNEQEKRHKIEAEISELLALNPDYEGTITKKDENFKIKITQSQSRYVNQEILLEIIKRENLNKHAHDFFNWKPSIRLEQWRNADDEIKKKFESAIFQKQMKPTFNIIKLED